MASFYPIKRLRGLILGGYVYPIYPRRNAPVLNVQSLVIFCTHIKWVPSATNVVVAVVLAVVRFLIY